jgi:hypothetical protein
MSLYRSAFVPSLLLAATLGCSPESNPAPSATSAKPESSGDPVVVRLADTHEIWLRPVAGRGALVRAATPPTGAFQTTPPADGEQVIRGFMDDVVVISGARFSPANPDDDLKVEVEWGDGQKSTSGCGPCRVNHVYRPGRYELTAIIHDRRLDRGSVTETFTVIVQGPAEPAAVPVGLPPNCHTITKANGACPTGATTFCVSDPVVVPTNPAHALAACNSCYGPGACTNFNVTCFGNPTTSFQASVNLATLNTGFVYARTSASGPLPGETSDFLLPSCPVGGRWAQ